MYCLRPSQIRRQGHADYGAESHRNPLIPITGRADKQLGCVKKSGADQKIVIADEAMIQLVDGVIFYFVL